MNAAHIHLMFNHLPVILTPVAAVAVAWSLLERGRGVRGFALTLALAASVLAWPAMLSGEGAEHVLEGMKLAEESFVEGHEKAAKLAMICSQLTGLIALVALFSRGRSRRERWATAGLLAGLVVTGSFMGWAATLGGEIRHTEIRPGAWVAGEGH